MPRKLSLSWLYRPLLTDTLPYELPVIFGNEKLFKLLTSPHPDAEIQKWINKIFPKDRSYTIPYQYDIRKDDFRSTRLSLVHPHLQTEICKFYSGKQASLISHCSRSNFSIRHPIGIAAVYVESNTASTTSTTKVGQIHSDSEDDIDIDKLVSFFAYSKYTLLAKFYESAEFLRLEKRFKFLRHLDISKCFYSIYTHSVTWAIKSKEFAKEQRSAYSFENEFDRLMQWANYNETNGIVVGPEVSRVFAEIILQAVDKKIEEALAIQGLVNHSDYAIRRYVDDFSVFANDIITLDKIQRTIVVELEEYKLYLNESKKADFHRPFISSLSAARQEVAIILAEVRRAIEVDNTRPVGASIQSPVQVRRLSDQLRSIVRRHGIAFDNLSGSVIGNLTGIAKKLSGLISSSTQADAEEWFRVIPPLADAALYLVAVDTRVRTTYSLCQFIDALQAIKEKVPSSLFDQIDFKLAEELTGAIRAQTSSSSVTASVEISNLLICGAHFLGSSFVTNTSVSNILKGLSNQKLSYFHYLTLKFCYLVEPIKFQSELRKLNADTLTAIGDGSRIKVDSEQFHLLMDHLSAPDVSPSEKRALLERVYGGTIANAKAELLGKALGFADWGGLQIHHTLRRRQLRPVYALT